MSELPVGTAQTAGDERHSRQQVRMIRFAKLWLIGMATTLLLGIGSAFAICPCGDDICGGNSCFPPETPQSCPADCGDPLPPPVELTVRVTVVPFDDPGQFNIHVGNMTLATNVPNGGSTGPHTISGGSRTLSETAGAGVTLDDYRRTICGGCSAGGIIQPGARQSCSITNLRLPTPPPAPGCASVCLSQFFQCGAAGEPPEFCRDVFNRCQNRCQISPARRLSITRYTRPRMPGANLTEADADNILASMSNVLRAFDGAGDIDCNVAFCRGGNIGEYAIGDGIVDTQGEIDAVFALPETVKVAREIDFCNNFDVLVAGCARGGTFIVERASSEGALWAHEYGHTRGLAHPNPDDPNAVMNRVLLPTTLRVNSRECIAYHLGASLAAVDVSMLGSAPTPAVTNEAAPLADIRDFVRQIFIHGTPYDDIMRYDSSVVPTLLGMLGDPQEEQAWSNIVIVLGILGDDRAVTPLISFIEQGEGELNYWRYKAKKNAIVGLGYLVAKSGDEKAVAYLREGIEPSAWVDRGIKWTSPDREAATERNRELSRMAIIGLGVSGHPSAAEALRALLTPAPTATGREFREQMSGVISEALKANQRIAKDGLAEYYRKSTP